MLVLLCPFCRSAILLPTYCHKGQKVTCPCCEREFDVPPEASNARTLEEIEKHLERLTPLGDRP